MVTDANDSLHWQPHDVNIKWTSRIPAEHEPLTLVYLNNEAKEPSANGYITQFQVDAVKPTLQRKSPVPMKDPGRHYPNPTVENCSEI